MRQPPFYCDWKACVLIEKRVQYEVNTNTLFKSYDRKTETISTILHSPQTILEKSNSNTAVTKVSSHVRIFKYLWIIQLVFGRSQSDFTRVALHPSPLNQSWDSLAHWKKSLASVNLALGSGGYILSVQSQKCSKSFFEDCLCEIVNFSSEFTFLAITQSLLRNCAKIYTGIHFNIFYTTK